MARGEGCDLVCEHVAGNESIVGHHLVPRLGSVPVGAVTTAQIDQILADLRRTLSVGMVSRIRMVIHASLAQAVRWDWIWSNPATHSVRFEVGPKAHDVPSVEVVQRHFVATQMLAAGVPLPVVSARLGHARVSTTLNVYAASMPAWDRAAAETLSSLLRAS